jgi:hypothetical protein
MASTQPTGHLADGGSPLPAEVRKRAGFSAAIVVGSVQRQRAPALPRFLTSPEARPTVGDRGLVPAPERPGSAALTGRACVRLLPLQWHRRGACGLRWPTRRCSGKVSAPWGRSAGRGSGKMSGPGWRSTGRRSTERSAAWWRPARRWSGKMSARRHRPGKASVTARWTAGWWCAGRYRRGETAASWRRPARMTIPSRPRMLVQVACNRIGRPMPVPPPVIKAPFAAKQKQRHRRAAGDDHRGVAIVAEPGINRVAIAFRRIARRRVIGWWIARWRIVRWRIVRWRIAGCAIAIVRWRRHIAPAHGQQKDHQREATAHQIHQIPFTVCKDKPRPEHWQRRTTPRVSYAICPSRAARAWTAWLLYTTTVATSPQKPARPIHRPGAARLPVASISQVETSGVNPPNSAVASA